MLGGRFRIVSMLGRGGMGEVYRADDLRLGQPVALKFLPSRLAKAPAERERLLAEVRVGREISHPNVCRIHDIVEIEDQIFISMEYVDGEDLASLLRRIGRLPTDKALSVARDVCAGLAAAHQKGILHRDLKPANVMLDGRGHARITDFGLATRNSSGPKGPQAGTPAYMAPEQLEGAAASVQSDVYALGLLLFEIFTGRRAIEADSLASIMESHQRLGDISLGALAPGLDASIERAIRSCLSVDAAARPATAAAVAALLPERDPLAAALAAGETPSPSVVADSGSIGDLGRPAAWSMITALGLLIVAYVALSERVDLHRRVSFPKSPELLRESARQIVALAGGRGLAVDDAHWMDADLSRVDPETDWPITASPHPFRFLYRESPRPLISLIDDAAMLNERRVTRQDPPLTVPGMANVTLDAEGRLLELIMVPSQRETSTSPRLVDWTPFLAAAGIELSSLSAATPSWTSPVDSDAKRSWEAKYPGGTDSVRIEAASYHGRPVWFATIMPWREPMSLEALPPPQWESVVLLFNVLLIVLLPVAAVLIIRRNFRRGRGDMRGAVVLGVTVFITLALAAGLRADHASSLFEEWVVYSQLTVEMFFFGLLSALFYFAAEPLVRRRWPEMLVSWSRLVAGRWRDPMIGRDLLIGAVAGLAVAAGSYLLALMIDGPGHVIAVKAATPLGSVRHAGYFLMRGIAEGLIRAIGAAFLLVLLRGFVRKTWLAAVLATGICAASILYLGVGSETARSVAAVLFAATGVFILIRFGLIATAATAYVILILHWIPTTLDPSSWFFGRSLLTYGTLVVLGLVGFFLSLGDKSVFPGAIFEE